VGDDFSASKWIREMYGGWFFPVPDGMTRLDAARTSTN